MGKPISVVEALTANRNHQECADSWKSMCTISHSGSICTTTIGTGYTSGFLFLPRELVVKHSMPWPEEPPRAGGPSGWTPKIWGFKISSQEGEQPLTASGCQFFELVFSSVLGNILSNRPPAIKKVRKRGDPQKLTGVSPPLTSQCLPSTPQVEC